MFKEKMKEIKAQIMNIGAEITNKTEELKSALNTEDLEKARDIRDEIDALKSQKEEAENNLKTYEVAEAGTGVNASGETHEVKAEGKSYRESVNEFIRSKGRIRNEGLRFEGQDEVLVPINEAVNPTQMDWKKQGLKK